MWFLFFHSDDKTTLLLFNSAFILLIQLFENNYQRCSWDIVTRKTGSPKRNDFSHLCGNNPLFWGRAQEMKVLALQKSMWLLAHMHAHTHAYTHMHTANMYQSIHGLHMGYMFWAASAGVSHSWMIYPFSVSVIWLCNNLTLTRLSLLFQFLTCFV